MWCGSTSTGARRSLPIGCSRPPVARRSSAWSTPRRPPGSDPTSSPSAPARATPSCWSTASPRSAAFRSAPTSGASTSPTPGPRSASGVPPGLSPITVADRARDRFVERSQSWYLDLRLIGEYVGAVGAKRAYHHTAPISMIYSLWGGLAAVARRRPRRRHRSPRRLRRAPAGRARRTRLRAVRRRGSPAPASSRPCGCPTASTTPPSGPTLLDRYGIEIGGGLGEFAGQGVADRLHGSHRPAPQRDPAAGCARRGARR